MSDGFCGEFFHNIDQKGRVIMPAIFREKLGEKFQVSKSPDKCLNIYPMDAWKEFEHKLTAIPDISDPRIRKIKRLLLGGSQECEADKQGRFLLPQPLRNYANLEKDIVLVGVGRYIEVWDQAAYANESSDDNLGDAFQAVGQYGL